VPAFFGLELSYGSEKYTVLRWYKNHIQKTRLQNNGKLINFLGIFDMAKSQAKEQVEENKDAKNVESWFIVQAIDYMIGISIGNEDEAKYFKFKHDVDEVIVMTSQSYEIDKKSITLALISFKKNGK